ncbi:hypothetical protein TTRE_0000600301 [Trichuris trichiura]|uniref:Uncharacterized protein n=1 Tax=Trichuris trichiura TaxID=36087 RepID=A0A077ZGH9_TRITR|nr:hypothetical protein TTRE_0000600301 [Trichuris trichiura]
MRPLPVPVRSLRTSTPEALRKGGSSLWRSKDNRDQALLSGDAFPVVSGCTSTETLQLHESEQWSEKTGQNPQDGTWNRCQNDSGTALPCVKEKSWTLKEGISTTLFSPVSD